MPRNRPVGGSYGGRVTQTATPSAGSELVPADQGEALRDGRVGRDDDRLGGHQAAGGVRCVGEQEPHVVGLLGLHEVEQRLAALLRELRDEVGGVVGLHLVEHVGGAVVAEVLEDADLVVLGQLLQHVGEAVVAELLGDLEHPLLRQVEHRVREVGGQQVGVAGDQLGRGLRLVRVGLLDDVGPRCEDRLALGERRRGGLGPAEEDLRDLPLAERGVLDRDILDLRVPGAVGQARSCGRGAPR